MIAEPTRLEIVDLEARSVKLVELAGIVPDGYFPPASLTVAGDDIFLRTKENVVYRFDAKGGKLLLTPTYERALELAEALQAKAAQHGHPLVCRAVRRQSPPNTSERTRDK